MIRTLTLAIALLLTFSATVRADGPHVCATAKLLDEQKAFAAAFPHIQLCALTPQDDATGAWAKQKLTEYEAMFKAGSFAPLVVTVTPPNATVTIPTVHPQMTFSSGQTVWIPFGNHRIEARALDHEGAARQVVVGSADPVSVEFTLEKVKPETDETTVDFGKEGTPHEETTSDELPDVERDTLLPKRFQKGGVTEAGEAPPSRFSFGARAGFSMSAPGGSDSPDSVSRIGVTAAVFARYRIGEQLGIQPEVAYVMKGNAAVEADYVATRMLAAYRIALGRSEVHLLLGPGLGINVGGDNIKEFEVTGVAGTGFSWPAGIGAFGIDLRIELGFTSIADTTPATSIYNRSATVTAGYIF